MSALADILTDLRDRLVRIEAKVDGLAVSVPRLEAATVELSREAKTLREWLLEEEQARRAVGVSVLEHEERLRRVGSSNGR